MKILKSWLQEHILEKLPSDEKITEAFTLKSCEVEEVSAYGESDTVFDIKVLPDRAHYMLSHRGVASDLCAVFGFNEYLTLRKDTYVDLEQNNKIVVDVRSDLCVRYTATLITNINNTESPEWLKYKLNAMGARSINAVVDLTNFLMFDMGQPLHAFDADKVSGPIVVRLASDGEKVQLLGGETVSLKSTHLVIADDIGVLAVAGVKGGKRAEVDLNTKNIILESANFNPVTVRKTSFDLGIRNDSSKRFENEITPELVKKGASVYVEIMETMIPTAKVSGFTDIYKTPRLSWKVSLPHHVIESTLNYEIAVNSVLKILKMLGRVEYNYGVYEVYPSAERLDLQLDVDIIDEIGRVMGLDRIKSIVPSITTSNVFSQEYLLTEKVKDFLYENNFTEVITRSFSNKGDIEVAYPMASDKGFLRNNLRDGLLQTMEQATRNAALLGLDEVLVFEIGKIFTKSGEKTALIVGIKNLKKKMERVNDKIKVIRDEMFKSLGVDVSILCTVDDSGGIVSFKGKTIGMTNNIDGVLEIEIDSLFDVVRLDLKSIKTELGNRTQFKTFSKEPFISRDIALFVTSDISVSDVQTVIGNSLRASAGNLLVKGPDLFDQFEKEGQVSLAFRMIFQADDRTLTDDEVNGYMDKLYTEIVSKGWKVR